MAAWTDLCSDLASATSQLCDLRQAMQRSQLQLLSP